PTMANAKLISFADILPEFIKFAAKINSGTASKTKESKPLTIFIGTGATGIYSIPIIPIKATIQITKAMGTPIIINTKEIANRRNPIIDLRPLLLKHGYDLPYDKSCK